MMEADRTNRRPVIAAAVTASCLMLVFGVAYRALAARLEGPGSSTPISSTVLGRFPLQMGDWTGLDVPLDEKIVRATDTDALLNRRYTRRGGLESVAFYIAAGVKARDLMPHRPEVCYVGAGWTRMTRRSLELPLGNGTRLPCNVLQFSRGALNEQRVLVLDYYIVDGEYCRDVSRLRFKALRGSGAVRYVAQMQITTSITETLTAEAARKIVSEFAAESAEPTARLFVDTSQDRPADELNKPPAKK